MTNKSLVQLVCVLILLASRTAGAVEAPKPVIVLFNEVNIQVFMSGLDIATSTGIEAIGLTGLNTSNLPVTNPDKRKSKLKVRLKVKNSANNVLRGQYVPYVDTRSYPYTESAVGMGTTYYCEEDGVVLVVDPAQEGYPCDFELGIGIANSGSNRYLVMGLAVFSWYDNAGEGTVDIGQASVTVFDPVSYAKLWRKTFKNTSGDWELEDNLSAVGDFLDDDGKDEVRIVYSRGLPNHAVEMRYRYYNIKTGNLIKEKKFNVDGP